jgi:signal transduction histidine kinase
VSRALFWVWVLVLLVAGWTVIEVPSTEIFAIETVVLSFALLYGFGVWPVGRTVVSIGAFVVVVAVAMLPRAAAGELPDAELIEIVVPVVLAVTVIFHVRRRELAIRQANTLAAADRRRAAARERLSRTTSHELRTPLTIASGYVDHLLEGERDEQRREDLLTVRDELEQVTRVSERLVRAVALDLGAPEQRTAVGPLLEEVRRRWAVVVDRDLVAECSVDTVAVNAERLRAALDTLVENAVRYTCSGMRIRLFATSEGGWARVGVADSGTGMLPRLVERINDGGGLPSDAQSDDDSALNLRVASPEALRDMYSQTGFGLRMVAAIAGSAGGRLHAGRAREGGASVALVVPTGEAASAHGHRTTRSTATVPTTPPPEAVTATP